MATKKTSGHAELLTLIEERAPNLIAAGVQSLQIDGLSVSLAPSVPEKRDIAPPKPDAIQPTHIDPLRDASTYPGGRIPGFTREDEIP